MPTIPVGKLISSPRAGIGHPQFNMTCDRRQHASASPTIHVGAPPPRPLNMSGRPKRPSQTWLRRSQSWVTCPGPAALGISALRGAGTCLAGTALKAVALAMERQLLTCHKCDANLDLKGNRFVSNRNRAPIRSFRSKRKQYSCESSNHVAFKWGG